MKGREPLRDSTFNFLAPRPPCLLLFTAVKVPPSVAYRRFTAIHENMYIRRNNFSTILSILIISTAIVRHLAAEAGEWNAYRLFMRQRKKNVRNKNKTGQMKPTKGKKSRDRKRKEGKAAWNRKEKGKKIAEKERYEGRVVGKKRGKRAENKGVCTVGRAENRSDDRVW